MQKYKSNIRKKMDQKIDSDFILDMNSASSKMVLSLLSRIVKNSETSLKLKAVAASESNIIAKISGEISIHSEGEINYFSFLKTTPLKITVKEPTDMEIIVDDSSWIEDADFTDELANIMDDAEISKIVEESTPPPIPQEEDPEAEWKKLKKGIKKEEDPDLSTSVFNFLNKYYTKISRKDVDKQLEMSLELDSSLVETFVIQNSYYFLELKKHRSFQQNKNLSENVKQLLRENRNANLEEKVFTYTELDKVILEFGLTSVVQNVRSGNWVIEDDLEDKDIIKLLSKGIITQEDIENLYYEGNIFGIEFEKIMAKKKFAVNSVLVHKKLLEDIQISEEFKDKQKTLWMKNNPSSLIHNDDLNALKIMIDNNEVSAVALFDNIIADRDLEVIKKSKKLEFLIKNYQIRVDQIIKYLSNVELFSEESNEIIISNEQIIIENPLILFKMIQNPLMKNDVKKILEERTTRLNNKQEQLKMVEEFKRFSSTQGIANNNEILQVLDLADKLYQIANNYDDSISSGMSLSGHTTDLHYDKDGYEILSSGEISRSLFQMMKNSPSESLVAYIYANDLIPFEFKIQPILENPSCPLKILSYYISNHPQYHYSILKNKLLPESMLEMIINQLFDIQYDSSIVSLILKHPHCSAKITEKLKSGVINLLSEIRNSKESGFIYKTFIDVYKHPENKKFLFEISEANKYRLLESCVQNYNAPISVLKYFTQLLGLDDKDVQEIVVSHPNIDLELLHKFVLNYPQNEIIFNAFKENPNWKDLSIQITKKFFENKQSVIKTVPLIVLDVLQKFQDVEELASFIGMDSESEAFQQMILSFDDFKSILKKDMLKKYLIIANNSNTIEQVTKIMLEVKNPDFGFFNGMIKISDAERKQILNACKNNPIFQINL